MTYRDGRLELDNGLCRQTTPVVYFASRGPGRTAKCKPNEVDVPNVVGWTLARRKTDDAGMLELLAPYAGHRYRVTRLIELGGTRPERHGPRMSIRDYRAF